MWALSFLQLLSAWKVVVQVTFFHTGKNPEGSERSAVFLGLALERIFHCYMATARRISWVFLVIQF